MRFVCNFLLIITCCFSQTGYAKQVLPGAQGSLILKSDIVQYDSRTDLLAASGNVRIFLDGYILGCDNLYYSQNEDMLVAEGNVHIRDKEGRVIIGQKAILKDKLKRGIIEELILKLPDNSLLVASYARRHGANRISLDKASFTPCKITCGREPIWQLKARHTDIDYEKEKITYNHMFFEIYGLPVAYLPYFSHPTPHAAAKSGLLVPGVINNDIVLPIYYRVKPNLDMTLAPRLAKNYTILEGELRHLTKYGRYEVRGSYGNPSYSKEGKKSRPARYYIFSKGNFHKNDIKYGFNINRASDKAYLTNYYNVHDSYLESEIYAGKAWERDYFFVEGYAFQGFRSDDAEDRDPVALPRIRMRKITGLNPEESITLQIKEDALAYSENYERQIARNALELELGTQVMAANGHLLNFVISNRNDLYWVNTRTKVGGREKKLGRNIPEFQAKWHYPLIKSFSNAISVKVEPTVMGVVGQDYTGNPRKFSLIDTEIYELSEYNLFKANRFSGLDYHDYGKRLSYGINGSLFSSSFYFEGFLGQLLYRGNMISAKGNADYVGSGSIDISGNLRLYYRFRRDKRFSQIRDEAGATLSVEKLTATVGFSSLNNIAKYYSQGESSFPANKASQINFDAGYQILPSVKLEAGLGVDVTKKIRLLQRTIRVTYAMDCVSISAKFYDDYTQDASRGIKKTSSKTFVVGLKVLNM